MERGTPGLATPNSYARLNQGALGALGAPGLTTLISQVGSVGVAEDVEQQGQGVPDRSRWLQEGISDQDHEGIF